jgi:hypothetical protein
MPIRPFILVKSPLHCRGRCAIAHYVVGRVQVRLRTSYARTAENLKKGIKSEGIIRLSWLTSMKQVGWPNGKALDYESRDCRFDPCVDQFFCFSDVFSCGRPHSLDVKLCIILLQFRCPGVLGHRVYPIRRTHKECSAFRGCIG